MSKAAAYLAELVEIFRFEMDNPGLKLTESDSRESIAEWDSLAHVRIVAAIERKFNIMFDIDEIEDANDVSKLSAAIARHLAAR